ncbi:MAG TPA: PHP domain-containing protein [Halanaerobiales bacterium]|nr:PHP domain-containing protein [Halanaerobiales bacterium]
MFSKEAITRESEPYDFILGSVHFWIDNMFPSQMVENNFPVDIAFERYWEEVYKAVECGGFDAIAHIDFPKRYYKKSILSEVQMRDIFKVMVANNIALEINTSSLRKGLKESMPDKDFLKLYKDTGGIKVTLGSDAHRVKDLASGYNYARAIIMEKLNSTVFINRRPKFEDELWRSCYE